MAFRFMDLPAELRIYIYEELLHHPSPVIIVSTDGRPVPIRGRLFPAILRTCKDVYTEALSTLYSTNTFKIRTFPLHLEQEPHTTCLRPAHFALVRRVTTIVFLAPSACRVHDKDGLIISKFSLDQEEMRQQTCKLGIQWEKLTLWAINVSRDADTVTASPEDWLTRPKSLEDFARFAIPGRMTLPTWSHWLIKKGSIPQPSR